MRANRIICVGNRTVESDRGGPLVFDRLQSAGLPEDVEVIDGGLGGLDLLAFVSGAARVVFVDSASGFGVAGEVVALDAQAVAQRADRAFGHGAGLPYLLRVLPELCDDPPSVSVLGLEGEPTEAMVEEAARRALSLARGVPGGAR